MKNPYAPPRAPRHAAEPAPGGSTKRPEDAIAWRVIPSAVFGLWGAIAVLVGAATLVGLAHAYVRTSDGTPLSTSVLSSLLAAIAGGLAIVVPGILFLIAARAFWKRRYRSAWFLALCGLGILVGIGWLIG